MKTNARDFALSQLDRIHLPGWQSNQLRRVISDPEDPRDLALAERIRVGVIKNLALLDHLAAHFSNRRTLDPLVRKILAIGLYQIRFLDRIPPSAAVDEAVEQARRMGRKHAAAFVNAVLRRATREPRVPLPTRDADPLGYGTLTLSHPKGLVNRLIEVAGEQGAIDLCEHDNREPPTLVRLFRGASIGQLAASNLTISPHERAGLYVIEGARRATLAEWSAKGIAQVQDATACAVIDRLQLQPKQDILDRCAGMGTKSLQIQDYLAPGGWIMAIEPSEARCDAIRALVRKRGIKNLAVVEARWLREISELKRPAFDRILIDAPCSNSGVLARRPEARYSQTPSAIESVAKLQDAILDDTAPYARSGGLIVYSTCSIWPEENQQRIARFLSEHPEFSELASETTFPSTASEAARYHDGGFVSVLKRR